MRRFALLLLAVPFGAQADVLDRPAADSPASSPGARDAQAAPSPSRVITLPSRNGVVSEACSEKAILAADGSIQKDRKYGEVRSRPLNALPNATLIYALDNRVGPCSKPIVIARDLGSRPDLPAPSIDGIPSAIPVPAQYNK